MMKKIINTLMLISIINAAPVFAGSNKAVVFSPYADITINTRWDSQYQDMEPADLVKISEASGVRSYHLAFITDAGSCTPAWGAQSSYAVSDAWGKHLTDRMHAAGISNIVSFGGASGNDVSLACTREQLIAVYESAITTYKPIGLDFDIENGTADVAKVMSALQKLQQAHSDVKLSFTLPVLPEGLATEGKSVVKQAQQAGLRFTVNIMAMDFGPAYSGDMAQYTIQATESLFGFLKTLYPMKSDADLWLMIEVTPMIGVNDVAVEQFTLSNVDVVRDFANKNHIAGLAIWSVARDNPCADKWASPICSGNNLQMVPYEFSKHFNQVN